MRRLATGAGTSSYLLPPAAGAAGRLLPVMAAGMSLSLSSLLLMLFVHEALLQGGKREEGGGWVGVETESKRQPGGKTPLEGFVSGALPCHLSNQMDLRYVIGDCQECMEEDASLNEVVASVGRCCGIDRANVANERFDMPELITHSPFCACREEKAKASQDSTIPLTIYRHCH